MRAGDGPCQGAGGPCGALACSRYDRYRTRNFSRGARPIMGGFVVPVIRVILALLDLYWWIIIISAIMSWLMAFNVINTYNRPVAMLVDVLYRLTEPVLRPIRNFLPNFGGIDIAPV